MTVILNQKHSARTKSFIPSPLMLLEIGQFPQLTLFFTHKSLTDQLVLPSLLYPLGSDDLPKSFAYITFSFTTSFFRSNCRSQHPQFCVFTTLPPSCWVFVSFEIVEKFSLIITFTAWVLLCFYFFLFFFYLINILLRLLVPSFLYYLLNFSLFKPLNCIIYFILIINFSRCHLL